jgi:hypothetical protein
LRGAATSDLVRREVNADRVGAKTELTCQTRSLGGCFWNDGIEEGEIAGSVAHTGLPPNYRVRPRGEYSQKSLLHHQRLSQMPRANNLASRDAVRGMGTKDNLVTTAVTDHTEGRG